MLKSCLFILFNHKGGRGLAVARTGASEEEKERENDAISGEALFNLLQVDGGSPIASPGLISNPHMLSITAHLPLGFRNRPQIACLEGKSTTVHFVFCRLLFSFPPSHSCTGSTPCSNLQTIFFSCITYNFM